jgi:SAM-dependent methyltransferase
MTERVDAACWSSYWASGALTSLPQDFQANYDGEIAEFWRQQADRAPDGASVLDVCTGNGAVALIIARAAQVLGKHFRITAVDAAEVQPRRVRERHPQWAGLVDRIRFVGGRPFEGIAVAPASVDLIVSQYGIEYCDWQRAAEQCARLLKPGGRLALISHSPDSDMLETMRAERAEYRVLAELELEGVIGAYLKGSGAAGDARAALESLRDALISHPRARDSALLGYALELVGGVLRMPRAQLQQQRPAVMQACRQLEDGRARLDQMLAVNQRLLDHPDWSEVFIEAGLEQLARGPLAYGGAHRVGEQLVFERPAP